MMEKPPPTISVILSIEPAIIVIGSTPPPRLIITVTSHAPQPITMFTWPTILNLRLSQKCKNFSCSDVETGVPVRMEMTKGPRRRAFTRTKGGPDDEYFCTFEPEVPVVFSHDFLPALRKTSDALQGDHRYRLAISSGEVVSYWWYGRRDDVLVSPQAPGPWSEARPYKGFLLKPSGEPLDISTAAPVEFEIRDPDALVAADGADSAS